MESHDCDVGRANIRSVFGLLFFTTFEKDENIALNRCVCVANVFSGRFVAFGIAVLVSDQPERCQEMGFQNAPTQSSA